MHINNTIRVRLLPGRPAYLLSLLRCPVALLLGADCDTMPGLEALLLQLTRLTYLGLSESELAELPASLAHLHNLRQLHVYDALRADAQASTSGGVSSSGCCCLKRLPCCLVGVIDQHESKI